MNIALMAAIVGVATSSAGRGKGLHAELARNLATTLGLQGRVMWIDATANLERIGSITGVKEMVERCQRAHINSIVVDVKPISGQVLYQSKISERLTSWKDKSFPDFDVLAAFIAEGHRAGLEVCASVNVFSEGHKYFNTGLAYKKPDWQSISYIVDRSLVSVDGKHLPIRAINEDEDSRRAIVYRDEFLQVPTTTPGKRLSVALDEEQRVAGMIDPALLDLEPLRGPEEGYLLSLTGDQMDWAGAHLRAGDRTKFDAKGTLVPVTESTGEKVAAFVNPLHPEARKYELDLLKEIVKSYDIDSIVLDRMRYANIFNDFSDHSKRAFERRIGRAVANWPNDIITFDPKPGSGYRRGKLFRPWLEFRARVIKDFVVEAVEAVRAIKPSVHVGAYVGSWFTEYYGVGVNWGSETFPVGTGWATPNYSDTGYAEQLDWLTTGCYFPIASREEARQLRKSNGGTVEAAAELSNLAANSVIPVYAGLYATHYRNRPDDFARAIEVAASQTSGVMLFDVSYIYEYGWWPLLEQTFRGDSIAPHTVNDYVSRLRSAASQIRTGTDVRGGGNTIPAVPGQAGGG